MHGLRIQACLFKYITVAVFCIYALKLKGRLKAVHFKNSHGNFIVDHGKIMELCF